MVTVSIVGYDTSPVLSFYKRVVLEEFAFLSELSPEIVISNLSSFPGVSWKIYVDGVGFGDYRLFESVEYVDSVFVRAIYALTADIRLAMYQGCLDKFVW